MWSLFEKERNFLAAKNETTSKMCYLQICIKCIDLIELGGLFFWDSWSFVVFSFHLSDQQSQNANGFWGIKLLIKFVTSFLRIINSDIQICTIIYYYPMHSRGLAHATGQVSWVCFQVRKAGPTIPTMFLRSMSNASSVNEIKLWLFSANRCDPNPCINGAKCVNDERKVDGFKCLCTSDFTGKNCQGKLLWLISILFVVVLWVRIFIRNFSSLLTLLLAWHIRLRFSLNSNIKYLLLWDCNPTVL